MCERRGRIRGEYRWYKRRGGVREREVITIGNTLYVYYNIINIYTYLLVDQNVIILFYIHRALE